MTKMEKPRILVVDDELLIREALVRTLRSFGRVAHAATGEQALQLIAEDSFDLCFLDLRLPGISGLEVMQRISELSPGTRVVVMTAYSSENLMPSINQYACHFITKPFELEDIWKITSSVLGSEDHRGDDKREPRSSRRKVSQVVTCRLQVRALGDSGAISLEVRLVDLGPGGLSLITDYPMEPGDALSFSEASELKPSTVRWRRPSETPHEFIVGVAFK